MVSGETIVIVAGYFALWAVQATSKPVLLVA